MQTALTPYSEDSAYAKRAEKLQKKAKAFLDEKQKAKARLVSLYTFIESIIQSAPLPSHQTGSSHTNSSSVVAADPNILSEYAIDQQIQQRFFQENCTQIFTVINENLNNFIDKSNPKAAKDKQDKSSKDVGELSRMATVLRKLINYIPEKIDSGWEYSGILKIIQVFLCPSNHPKIRTEGVRIMLVLINNRPSLFEGVLNYPQHLVAPESLDLIKLYSMAVNLGIFEASPIPTPTDAATSDCLGSDGIPGFQISCDSVPRKVGVIKHKLSAERDINNDLEVQPICANPNYPAESDSVEIIEEILSNIVSLSLAAGVSNSTSNLSASHWHAFIKQANVDEGLIEHSVYNRDAFKALATHWHLFKHCYISTLFPSVCSKFSIISSEGFIACPLELLQSLLLFVASNVVGNAVETSAQLNLSSETLLKRPKVLQIFLLSGPENREILHEIVRQGLLTPWMNSELGRYSMSILRSWVFSANDERPLFLRKGAFPGTNLHISNDQDAKADIVDGKISLDSNPFLNHYMRRYIRYIELLFLDKKDYVENVDQQMVLWREGFQFYRLLSMELFHIQLENDTWKTLIASIISIIDRTLCRPNKFAGVASPKDAGDICDLALESLFFIWIRSSEQLDWKILVETVQKCTRWNQLITQYVKIVLSLTKVMGRQVFGVEVDQIQLHDADSKSSQRFRTASVHALKLRTSVQSASSHHRTKSHVSASSFDNLDESVKRPMEHSGGSDHQNVVHVEASDDISLLITKRAEAAKKLEQNFQALKDATKGSNSSMGSFLSLDGSNEKIIERPFQGFFYKIPPLNAVLQSHIHEFTNLNNVASNWTTDHCYVLWKNMLCVFGNINSLANTTSHFELVRCITNICDSFEKIRAVQSFDFALMPSMFEFATWLFEACDLPVEFNESRALAYGHVCRIMCRRHDQELPEDSLPHFYRIILKGLESEDNKIISEIMINSTSLFDLMLPGSFILISSFIKCTKYMFTSKDVIFPEKSKEAAISILSSITILPQWKSIDGNPTLKKTPNDLSTQKAHEKAKSGASSTHSLNSDTSFLKVSRSLSILNGNDVTETYSEDHFRWKIKIKDLLLELIKQVRDPLKGKVSSHTHVMLMWVMAMLTFEEMTSALSPSSEIIDDGINCLLEHLVTGNLSAMTAAVDCLTIFARESFFLDCVIDLGIMRRVIDKATFSISEQILQHKGDTKEFVITKLLYCLMHWVMIYSSGILSNEKMCCLVFEALDLVSKEGDKESIEIPESGGTSLLKQKFAKSESTGSTGKLSLTRAERNMDDDEQEENLLKDTIENIIGHFLHFYYNFSPPFGPVALSSQILEPCLYDDKSSEKMLFFSEDCTLLAFAEDSNDSGIQSRIGSRTLAGHFIWDCRLFYKRHSKINHQKHHSRSPINSLVIRVDSGPDVPFVEEQEDDLLECLIKNISESYVECCETHENENLILATHSAEIVQTIQYHNSEKCNESSQLADYIPSIHDPGVMATAYHFTSSRIFLSQFGHFNFDSTKEGSFHQLLKSPALIRDIKGVDKRFGRETVKVGLLYVAAGQEDESTILKNNTASHEYYEFVQSLGWEIDIATHTGYIGGLEKNLAAGSKAVYYCDHTVEIIYHDAIKIPNDPHDTKQVKKKRHIGNDHVHIIWNEHYRDYGRNTIGGDFGNAQIVITPLMNDQYAITTYKDIKVDFFGPLQDRAIVSKAALGPLVRNTVIHAYRNTVYPGLEQIHHPYSQRATDINMVASRHKNPKFTFVGYLDSFCE